MLSCLGKTARESRRAERELIDELCYPWIGLLIFLKCSILEPNVSPNLQNGERKPVGFKAVMDGWTVL